MAQQSYEIGDFRFGLRTTSEQFLLWVNDVLPHYRVEGETDPFYSIVFANGGTGSGHRGKRDYSILYTAVCAYVRTLEPASLGYAFLTQLETHLFAARSDLVFLDAVAVPVAGKIALLPRSSLPDLARLGRGASRFGLSLPAATAVAIDPDTGLVVPFDRKVQAVPDISHALEALGSAGDVRDLFVIREPVHVDVVGTWDRRRGRAFEQLPRAETLHHLAEGAFNLKAMGGRVLTGLERMLEGADCYGLVPMPSQQLAKGLAGLG